MPSAPTQYRWYGSVLQGTEILYFLCDHHRKRPVSHSGIIYFFINHTPVPITYSVMRCKQCERDFLTEGETVELLSLRLLGGDRALIEEILNNKGYVRIGRIDGNKD